MGTGTIIKYHWYLSRYAGTKLSIAGPPSTESVRARKSIVRGKLLHPAPRLERDGVKRHAHHTENFQLIVEKLHRDYLSNPSVLASARPCTLVSFARMEEKLRVEMDTMSIGMRPARKEISLAR